MPVRQETAATAVAPPEVRATEDYRARVLAALRDGSWNDRSVRAAQAAVNQLRGRRADGLAPSHAHAVATALKTALFALAPIVAADVLWQHGFPWAAPPLVLVAGMALYGAVAIVHDLAHGSFFPSKRLNHRVGHVVAPLLFMSYGGFRRSHLDHHRHSQSMADPKRFGATHSAEANEPHYRTIDQTPPFLRGPVLLGASVARWPLRLRQFMYLAVAPVFFGPAVLFFAGEFSVVKRNWRLPEAWLSTLQSLALAIALAALSPRLLALYLAALVVGYSFVFFVFAAHLSPNQVYWTSARRAELADALNVSDVRCGALLRWLGNGFADHHSTHHLAPSVPCYRLARAAAMVAPGLAPLRAPALDLLNPAACALLYDNYFRAIVETNAEAWDYTPRGALRNLRRAPPFGSGPSTAGRRVEEGRVRR